MGEKAAVHLAKLVGYHGGTDGAARAGAAGHRVIKIVTGEFGKAVKDVEEALLESKQPILQRGNFGLVQPIFMQLPKAGGGKTQATILRPLSALNLAYIISKHCASFWKYDGRAKCDVRIDPPMKVLQGLLDLGHWGFPRVTGVINSPTSRPDGSILREAGYDASTGLWHWPDTNLDVPPIPDAPDRDAALAALGLLKDLLIEFPFVSNIDRSVALAAILTAVLRGGFELAPLFLFAAHDAGSGKSYMANIISSIVRGRPCPVITLTRDRDEMEKRLGALLLECVPIISLDNVSVDLEGDLLCQMVEQPLIRVRVLGRSEVPECEWRGVLLSTGNNVGLTGDMVRRGITCNLDPHVERPELRKCKFDPVQKVLANRGAYIAAALIIACAHRAAGRPECPDPIGSYGGWSDTVRAALMWLDEEDPWESTKGARKADPERILHAQLIGCWAKHLGGTDQLVSEIIKIGTEQKEDHLANGAKLTKPKRPEFNTVLLELAGWNGRIDPKLLGRRIRAMMGAECMTAIGLCEPELDRATLRNGNWKRRPTLNLSAKGMRGINLVTVKKMKRPIFLRMFRFEEGKGSRGSGDHRGSASKPWREND